MELLVVAGADAGNQFTLEGNEVLIGRGQPESGQTDVIRLDDRSISRKQAWIRRDAEEMIAVGQKAHEAGVKLSTMILLGAGGRAGSRDHAIESARVVNAIQPRFVSTLVMTPVEDTPLWEEDQRGEVDHLDPVELACELREFIAGLELNASVFRSNHASNYLALAGTLPKDKERLVAGLDEVLSHPERARFLPEWMRGL